MKILRIVLLLCVLATASCVEMEQTLTINTDRSGSLEIDYAISEKAITHIKGLIKLQSEIANSANISHTGITKNDYIYMVFIDPNEDDIREDLKKYEESGITVGNLRVKSTGFNRIVRLKVLFDSIDDFIKAKPFAGLGLSFSKNNSNNYVLSRTPPLNRQARSAKISSPEDVKRVSPILNGFKARLEIQAPGRILKTNAPEKLPRKASWTYDFNKDPNVLSTLQNQKLTVVYAGQ